MAGHSQGYPYDDEDDLDSETLFPGRGLVHRSFVIALFTAILTATGIFFALRSPQERLVPALVGVSLAKARSLLSAEGLALIAAGSKSDPLVAAGSISLQDPVAGRTLLPRGAVIVLVSTGLAKSAPASRAARTQPPPRALPAAIPAQATAVATPPSKGSPAPSPKAAPGASRPRRAVESPVATGPTVTVPKLTGVRLNFALPRLRRAGLVLGSVSYRSDEDHIPGYVLHQKPAAGASLPRGTKVELVVNRTDD